MDHLDGKVAVVTGAASGIGRAMAERFLSEKMAVVAADIEESALRRIVDHLRADGGDVEAVPTDVRDPASVQARGGHCAQSHEPHSCTTSSPRPTASQ